MISHLYLLFGFVTLALSLLTTFISAYACVRTARRSELMGLVSLMGSMMSVEAALALCVFLFQAVVFFMGERAVAPHAHEYLIDAVACPKEGFWWVRSLSYMAPLAFYFAGNRERPFRAFLISMLTLIPRLFFFFLFVVFHQISC